VYMKARRHFGVERDTLAHLSRGALYGVILAQKRVLAGRRALHGDTSLGVTLSSRSLPERDTLTRKNTTMPCSFSLTPVFC
jgi:hypothetical protein